MILRLSGCVYGSVFTLPITILTYSDSADDLFISDNVGRRIIETNTVDLDGVISYVHRHISSSLQPITIQHTSYDTIFS